MSHYERIKQWAKERKIYEIPFNPLKQIGFLVEETHEFITANNDNERIDALCDMAVFATNAIYTLDREYQIDDSVSHTMQYKQDNIIIDMSSDLLLCCLNVNCLYCDDKELSKQTVLAEFSQVIKTMRYCVEELGYNYDKAMDETLKEIESRAGYFDDTRGKWVKTETKYKADYELARIER